MEIDNYSHWTSHYRKLFDILSQSDWFDVARRPRLPKKVPKDHWPEDFLAFRSVFNDEIGFNGHSLITTVDPQTYATSDTFSLMYAGEGNKISGEGFFEDSDVKISEIYWLGYTAHAYDVIGFYSLQDSFRIISTFSKKETFTSFLCDELEETFIFLPKVLVNYIKQWIDEAAEHNN